MPSVLTRPCQHLDHDHDQRVYLYGISWQQYEQLLAMRGESAVPRITFIEGTVELMSPSRSHEWIKKVLARLVEAYAEERDIPLNGIGSWTLKASKHERGLEPDECYIVGDKKTTRPDFALEVIWSHPGINKLEIYRKLGVREVWIYRQGAIAVHELRGDRYCERAGSGILPSLDLARIVEALGDSNQTATVKRWRAWLRSEAAGPASGQE